MKGSKMLSEKEKAEAFDKICSQVEKSIEDKIDDWLSENPYFEEDDEDLGGNRTFHCPATTTKDAREHLSEDLLDKADDMGFYDFFELIINQVYGEPMRPENEYRPVENPSTTANLLNDIITSHLNLQGQIAKAGAK